MKNVLIILIFVSIIVVSSGCDMIEVTINGGDVNNENEYEDGEILATYSDNTNRVTTPILLPDGWELQWNYEGEGNFIVWVHNGEYPELAANHIDSGEGSYYEPHGGEYYFDITARRVLKNPLFS